MRQDGGPSATGGPVSWVRRLVRRLFGAGQAKLDAPAESKGKSQSKRDHRLLVAMLIISIAAGAGSLIAIRQAERGLLKAEASAAAIHWAMFLQEHLSELDEILSDGLVSARDQRVFDFASEAGRVIRYEVIRADGITAHSSWAGDFKKSGVEDDLSRVMATGKPLVILNTDTRFSAKVKVEGAAYVPMMTERGISAVIKVYVDMTDRALALRGIGNGALAALIVLLVVLGSVISYFVWHNIRDRNRELEKVRRSRRRIEQAQTTIRALSQRNEMILNTAGEGIYGLDMEGRTTFINPAAAQMIGWQPEELIGKPQHAILHHTKADGSPYPRDECPIYDALSDGTAHHVSDEVFWCKDGTSFPVEYTSTPIRNDSGKQAGAVVVFKDITERKRAEDELSNSNARFKDFAELASDWFWEMDEQLRFSYVSEKSTLGGRFDLIGLVGKSPAHLPAPDDLEPELWQSYLDSFAAHESLRAVTFARPGVDGRPVHIRINGNPVFDAQGNFNGYRGTGTDVTAELDALQALRVARDEAQLANTAKSEFLANMSHELRTPLNAVIGFSQAMLLGLGGPLTDKQKEHLGDIETSGDHLLALINDVLDLSKIELGELEFNEGSVDLSDCIETSVRMFNERKHEARLKVEMSDLVDLPPIRGDSRKIRQILLNLLSNAFKFTDREDKIVVGGGVKSDETIYFEVADTGIGMSPEEVEIALTVFGQVDSGMDRNFEGTGLGLPLCKSLAEAHGGTLEIESEPGVGTTVRVLFPPERVVVGLQQAI